LSSISEIYFEVIDSGDKAAPYLPRAAFSGREHVEGAAGTVERGEHGTVVGDQLAGAPLAILKGELHGLAVFSPVQYFDELALMDSFEHGAGD